MFSFFPNLAGKLRRFRNPAKSRAADRKEPVQPVNTAPKTLQREREKKKDAEKPNRARSQIAKDGGIESEGRWAVGSVSGLSL